MMFSVFENVCKTPISLQPDLEIWDISTKFSFRFGHAQPQRPGQLSLQTAECMDPTYGRETHRRRSDCHVLTGSCAFSSRNLVGEHFSRLVTRA